LPPQITHCARTAIPLFLCSRLLCLVRPARLSGLPACCPPAWWQSAVRSDCRTGLRARLGFGIETAHWLLGYALPLAACLSAFRPSCLPNSFNCLLLTASCLLNSEF